MKRFIVALLVSQLFFSCAFSKNHQQNLIDPLQLDARPTKHQSNTRALIIATVGSDNNCQYSLIQDAINAANNTLNTYEIRVASNKTYTESLVLDFVDLTVKGGFANCSDASNNVGNNSQTSLDTTGLNLPVMTLKNSDTSSSNAYKILNFEITGGVATATAPGGGVNILDSGIRLDLENALIHANTGTKGGGIYAKGFNSSVFIKDTLIILNTATNGGGFYCDGLSTLFIFGDSGVSSNNANGTSFDGNGGGLYLTDSCRMDFFSGTAGGVGDLRGISGNTANRNGGGLYAEAGSIAKMWGYYIFGDWGNNTAPVNITNNKANVAQGTASGGGIYATGSATEVLAYATIINDNEVSAGVSSSGAGVSLDQAKFSLSRLDDKNCWNTQKCNQMVGNKVFGANATGAGIQALTGADVTLKNTWVSGHHSTSSAFMYGQEITATIEGNVFEGNGGTSVEGNTSLLYIYGANSNASIVYNTFVNNQLNNSLLRINVNPNLLFFANIVKESNNVTVLETVTGGASNSQFKCLIVHEDQSFTGTTVSLADPKFVDEANGNFNILDTSPAIDLCGTDYATPAKDLDETDRGWDDLLTSNTLGAFDAGADEFYPATTADLSVTKTLTTAAPFAVNDVVNYEVIVSNAGPDTATNIRVEDTPSGMTLSTVQSTSCSSFPCTIGSLASGASETIQVNAQLRSTPGSFDNSAFVYSEDYDADMSNNTDNTGNAGVVGQESVDMALSFNLVTQGPYHSGQILTYQADVTNNGPNSANNVVISASNLNTQISNVTGTPCTALPCTIASFASGTTVNLSISVQINAGGDFNFGVSVATDSTDTDPSNNTGSLANLTALNTADISLDSNLLSPPEYLPGDFIDIQYTLYNNGPEAGEPSISTNLTNLQFVSLVGSSCPGFPCYMGVLQSGDSKILTVKYLILGSGTFSSESSVSSISTYEPDSSNNNSSVGDIASSVADIAVSIQMVTTGDYYIDQQVELLVTVDNNGPDSSDIIDFVLSNDNLTIDSMSGANCISSTCQLAALGNGESHQISVLATITDNAVFLLSAQVSSITSDTDLINNVGEYIGIVSVNPDIVFANSFE